MEKLMKYSVLRYSPSKVAGEQINLGVLFEDKSVDFREFRYLKKFRRLSSFDDELEIEVVKEMLKSIREDVTGNLLTKKFEFEEYIKFFINDFYFDEPKIISYEDENEIVEDIYKVYFRLDLESSERPSISDERKLVSRILSDNGKTISKEKCLYGKYNDKITCDFITEDYCIKLFDFDNKDLSRIINSVKTWAWNAQHTPEKKYIIIYKYDSEHEIEQNKSLDGIKDILKDSGAEVMNIEKLLSSSFFEM